MDRKMKLTIMRASGKKESVMDKEEKYLKMAEYVKASLKTIILCLDA